MRRAQAFRLALALCAVAVVEAVISPKVFIIDFVRRSSVALFDFRIADHEPNAVWR